MRLRARCLAALGYPDLAIGDFHKTMLLYQVVQDQPISSMAYQVRNAVASELLWNNDKLSDLSTLDLNQVALETN